MVSLRNAYVSGEFGCNVFDSELDLGASNADIIAVFVANSLVQSANPSKPPLFDARIGVNSCWPAGATPALLVPTWSRFVDDGTAIRDHTGTPKVYHDGPNGMAIYHVRSPLISFRMPIANHFDNDDLPLFWPEQQDPMPSSGLTYVLMQYANALLTPDEKQALLSKCHALLNTRRTFNEFGGYSGIFEQLYAQAVELDENHTRVDPQRLHLIPEGALLCSWFKDDVNVDLKRPRLGLDLLRL